MTRKTLARLAGVIVLAGVVTAVLLVFRPGGKTDKASPLPSVDMPASAEAQELASLVRKGQDITYHAVYKTVGAIPSGSSLQIELWRKGALVRQDQVVQVDNRIARTEGFRLKNKTIVCTREGKGAWSCQPGAGPSPGTSAADPLLGQVVTELADKQVKVKDATVAGQRARCFTISNGDQSSQLCVTKDGITVAIRAGSTNLELVHLERTVDDSVFTPPVG